ncbi:TRAP transporter substrate-binding protein [Salinicoccus kekensis]|uniref:Tripartite ATP-independent transporter DctP family solute receptor n=1 Tax=Salinicoccus kekensis TaxID=714307 RepID=A0A285U710_9STAP|nr:TRAP transporter substrate-binding protein [Salinicoccus kekensis]SOC37619.1 tripartite ATP-independent transporter DctP family solute receptor [Salinicoccus kekensis]
MKKFLWLTLLSVMVLALAACGNGGEEGEETDDQAADNGNDSEEQASGDGEQITWSLGHLSNEDHIWHTTSEEFARLVEEKTDGQINIQIYPNSQLGGEVDTINSIRAGNTDMVITGESMENWSPKAALLAAPYAIRDSEHLQTVVEGDVGSEIEEDIVDKVGVTPLFYMERAPRNLTSNDPIESPEDLSGFSMRIPNVPLFMDAWSAAGASPQVMDFSEVFTGLQQNVIDGQENPVDLIHSGGLYEVQEYVNETEHVYSWIYVVVGNEQWESIGEDLQASVMEAAEEAEEYAAGLLGEEIENYRQMLEDEGMEFVEVDREAFQEAMQPGIENSLDEEQLDLYERIIDTE